MINPKYFIESLSNYGIDFYAGVPDSLLKDICAYISENVDNKHNIITANEGGAVGLAAGYHLATGKIPLIYMQNSGLGNTINPLVSLTDKEVYNIPLLLLIGWRGKPGEKDEPQHKKQGKITLSMLDTIGIKYVIMSKETNVFTQQLEEVISYIKETKEAYAFVVEKGTFEPYIKNKVEEDCSNFMSREEAVQIVANTVSDTDVIVSTTGMISRELFEYRDKLEITHKRDFLTVGSMGHASQIALGIALEKTDLRIYCFDGDGASIMHMGSMAIIASKSPNNYFHIIFNNGAHDSVGGQPTVGFLINFQNLAKSFGYKNVFSVTNKVVLISTLETVKTLNGPVLIEIKVRKGNRNDLGRPTTTPIENKEAFMTFLNY